MSNLIVRGGLRLSGRIIPSANKNAVLPILCATLLTDEPVILRGVPDITDVNQILGLFRALGSEVDLDPATRVLRLRHGGAGGAAAARLPEGMRSSIMLIPPMIARFGEARIEGEVKGCTLGVREIDPHIEVFQTFGVEVAPEDGALAMSARGRFRPADHWLDYASVTTTENFVLCAAKASGTSQLMNAASEPHVQEFCAFLRLMGARIEGCGTSRLVVEGVESLGGADYTFAEDFHEIATFLALGAITGGDVAVRNAQPEQFPLIDRAFAKFGVDIEHAGGWSTSPRRRAAAPSKRRSPATSCRRSRPRPGPICLWTCCRSSSPWAPAPTAKCCSGTRSMKAPWAGPRSWPSSAATPCSAIRTG